MALLSAGTGAVDIIRDLVSTVGFPIVAYFLMVKSNSDMMKAHKEEMKETTESMREAQDKIVIALEKNTEVIEELKTIVGRN